MEQTIYSSEDATIIIVQSDCKFTSSFVHTKICIFFSLSTVLQTCSFIKNILKFKVELSFQIISYGVLMFNS